MTPEKKSKKIVRDALNDHDCYYTMPVTAGFGNSGVPDFIGCHKGRFFGIEVKANTKVSALQQANLKMIEDSGGRAFVVRINDKETVGLIALLDFLEE